jgi:hypothetical protein
VYTSNLVWLDGRLDRFETQGALGIPLTLTYLYAPGGELESVVTSNTMTGAPYKTFSLTRGSDAQTVTGGLLATGSDYTATWDFTCP